MYIYELLNADCLQHIEDYEVITRVSDYILQGDISYMIKPTDTLDLNNKYQYKINNLNETMFICIMQILIKNHFYTMYDHVFSCFKSSNIVYNLNIFFILDR